MKVLFDLFTFMLEKSCSETLTVASILVGGYLELNMESSVLSNSLTCFLSSFLISQAVTFPNASLSELPVSRIC